MDQIKNQRINTEMTICNIILSMERPFKISQLLSQAERYHITNKDLVLDVLDQLCESGLVKYSEIENDVWAYKNLKIAYA